MDKKREFETPNEQRCLLNAGHGPPSTEHKKLMLSYGNPEYMTAPLGYSTQRPQTTTITPSSYAVARPPYYISSIQRGEAYQFLDGKDLFEEIKVQNDKIQFLELKLSRQDRMEEELRETRLFNRELEKRIKILQELTLKENEEARTSSNMENSKGKDVVGLAESLPPDISTKSGITDRESENFIHLMASEDPPHEANDRTPTDDDQLMKSIQCSDASLEEPVHQIKEEKEAGKLDSPDVQSRGVRNVCLSSSSSSFEVVGDAYLQTSNAEVLKKIILDQQAPYKNLELLQQELEQELANLKLRENELKCQIEAETTTREKQFAELKNTIEKFVQQKCQDDVALGVMTSEDMQSKWIKQIETLKRDLAKVEFDNFKLSRDTQELMRENNYLKKLEQERRQTSSTTNDDKHEAERERARRRAVENVLETKAQLLSDMEARVKELEHALAMQQNRPDNSEVATENALLKHQIDAYKEDFEVERKDREKIVSQKDTLQQCYDTLRTELSVARKQVRKFEDDISMLRIDNDTLKAKLREVTEELGRLNDRRQSRMGATNDFGLASSQNSTLSNPTLQNAFAPKMYSASTDVRSVEWECKVCTYKNPALRTFCEMCGTHAPSRPASTPQVPNTSYFPNIPVTSGFGQQSHWNMASPPHTSPALLPNLRNYGDIETD